MTDQPALLSLDEDQIETGDKVRFDGGEGKVLKFSTDAKRVQVEYLAFDGLAQKWFDVADVSKVDAPAKPSPKVEPKYKPLDVVLTHDDFVLVIQAPIRELPAGTYQCCNLWASGLGTVTDDQIKEEITGGAALAFIAQYQKNKEQHVQKPSYQKGDVVLRANGLIHEILSEAEIDESERWKWGPGEVFNTLNLMNNGVGNIGVTSIIKKIDTSSAMGIKRLSMLMHSAKEDQTRLERIRAQQEKALKDAVKKMESMSQDATPTKKDEQIIAVDDIPVKAAAPKLIKVQEIGDEGVSIPDGWRLLEVKSVFNVIKERTTHYVVIVQ